MSIVTCQLSFDSFKNALQKLVLSTTQHLYTQNVKNEVLGILVILSNVNY